MRGIVTGKQRFGDESGADNQLSWVVSGGAQCLHPAQPTGNSFQLARFWSTILRS